MQGVFFNSNVVSAVQRSENGSMVYVGYFVSLDVVWQIETQIVGGPLLSIT